MSVYFRKFMAEYDFEPEILPGDIVVVDGVGRRKVFKAVPTSTPVDCDECMLDQNGIRVNGQIFTGLCGCVGVHCAADVHKYAWKKIPLSHITEDLL